VGEGWRRASSGAPTADRRDSCRDSGGGLGGVVKNGLAGGKREASVEPVPDIWHVEDWGHLVLGR